MHLLLLQLKNTKTTKGFVNRIRLPEKPSKLPFSGLNIPRETDLTNHNYRYLLAMTVAKTAAI